MTDISAIGPKELNSWQKRRDFRLFCTGPDWTCKTKKCDLTKHCLISTALVVLLLPIKESVVF